MTIDIYAYCTCVSYLQALIESKKEKNQRFSLRMWAKQLKLRTPSILSAALSHQRAFPFDLAEKIANDAKLLPEERRYFHLLVLHNNAHAESEKEALQGLLDEYAPAKRGRTVELERFQMIAQWYNLPIYASFSLSEPPRSVADIIKLFDGDLSESVIRDSLRRLCLLELLRENSEGFFETTGEQIWFGDTQPSKAMRQFHTGMIEQALRALRDLPMSERDVRGSTLCLTKAQYEEVVSRLKRWFRSLHKRYQTEGGEAVYQIQSQVFPITRRSHDTMH